MASAGGAAGITAAKPNGHSFCSNNPDCTLKFPCSIIAIATPRHSANYPYLPLACQSSCAPSRETRGRACDATFQPNLFPRSSTRHGDWSVKKNNQTVNPPWSERDSPYFFTPAFLFLELGSSESLDEALSTVAARNAVVDLRLFEVDPETDEDPVVPGDVGTESVVDVS